MIPAARLRALIRLSLVIAGTGIGILLLILLLHSVNIDQVGAAFADADYRYLLPVIVLLVINVLLKVPRWALLLGADAPNADTLFGAMSVGYALNTLLPARLGEVVRAYWVRDRARVSMARVLSTIALERVLDGVALIILLTLVLPTVDFPHKILGPALTLGAIFIVAFIAMVVLAHVSSREGHPLLGHLERLEKSSLAPIGRIVRQLLTGLESLRSGRAVALIIVYTVIIWLSNVFLLWFTLRAFHIKVPVTAAILLTSILNLGMAVPSTPGYVGVFEYLMVLTLGLYNVKHAPALAAAFAFHAIAFVPITIVGIVYIARAGVEATIGMVRAGSEGVPSAGET